MPESVEKCVHCGWSFGNSEREIVAAEEELPSPPQLLFELFFLLFVVGIVVALWFALGQPRIAPE